MNRSMIIIVMVIDLTIIIIVVLFVVLSHLGLSSIRLVLRGQERRERKGERVAATSFVPSCPAVTVHLSGEFRIAPIRGDRQGERVAATAGGKSVYGWVGSWGEGCSRLRSIKKSTVWKPEQREPRSRVIQRQGQFG